MQKKMTRKDLDQTLEFKTNLEMPFTVARLETTKYKALLKQHLHAMYSAASTEQLRAMDGRIECFAKTSFVFAFKCADSEFGMIYYLTPQIGALLKEINTIVKRLEKCRPPRLNLSYFFYNDSIISRAPEKEEVILSSIRKNLAPGTLMLLEKRKGGS